MNRPQSTFGPDAGMVEAVATCVAGWLAMNAARADLDFVWRAVGILFGL